MKVEFQYYTIIEVHALGKQHGKQGRESKAKLRPKITTKWENILKQQHQMPHKRQRIPYQIC